MLGAMLMAVPAMAQDSKITQEDCDAGRITRDGERLSQSECEARIGQQVRLADTGFEAWIIGLGGVALMAGAGVVLVRRRPSRTLA
jgi:LPXTG-motif cell wall-anchored protein